jgi:hypothetical protein
MTHIMIDLETLSTRTNAAIVSIGAVKFDAERGVYDKYYQVVAHKDRPAFDMCPDTLVWWSKQSEEARAIFTDPTGTPIEQALLDFSLWTLNGSDKKAIRMWGNGAAFDNVILSTAYDICDFDKPWMLYNDRCYRTMKSLYPDIELIRTGTHHNAVDDAESQATHLLAMQVLKC